MAKPILTIQYLEDAPDLAALNISTLLNRLKSAVDCLPITHLIIGWQLPQPLLNACRKEAERLGLRFIRWQPLLTSDKGVHHHPSWLTEGLTGQKVQGYRELPEFTFFCPNHPSVREGVLNHLASLANQGDYAGFFLDRIRFPSPSADPLKDLACFCAHCCQKAADLGLDLPEIRADILQFTRAEKGRIALVKHLLGSQLDETDTGLNLALRQFVSFRQDCIRDFLTLISQPLREAHLEIGLDCFSPRLTPMVGQDLKAMSEQVSWIKLMTYGHTYAPAGIPYELSGLVHYLTATTHLDESQALGWLVEWCGLSLPPGYQGLERDGIPASFLEKEVLRGVSACSVPVLAGIELVDLPGVTDLNEHQIRADLAAIKHAAPAGLAISWDLLRIPLNRLELVKQSYLEAN